VPARLRRTGSRQRRACSRRSPPSFSLRSFVEEVVCAEIQRRSEVFSLLLGYKLDRFSDLADLAGRQ
jgi:hypothetical protein